jgi:hypothetical protein
MVNGNTLLLVILGLLALGACLGALGYAWPWVVSGMTGYLVLPLRSRGEGMPATPELVEVSPEETPADEREALACAARQLDVAGYRFVKQLRQIGAFPTTEAVFSLWLHPVERVMAEAIAIRVRRTDLPDFRNDVCTFEAEFSDGSTVVTTNAPDGVFRPDPARDSLRWPGMEDLSVLHRLHVARVARLRRGRDLVLPPAEEAVAYLRAGELKELWRQVAAGYMWFDADGNTFRRTLKGAFLMYWKLLWPWKQRLASRNEQKLRRELRDLGMGTPEDYRPSPQGPEPPQRIAYASGVVE